MSHKSIFISCGKMLRKRLERRERNDCFKCVSEKWEWWGQKSELPHNSGRDVHLWSQGKVCRVCEPKNGFVVWDAKLMEISFDCLDSHCTRRKSGPLRIK